MIFNIKEGRFIEKENVKKIQYEDYDVYKTIIMKKLPFPVTNGE